MTDKLFMFSVADCYALDDEDNIIFTGKTLMDSNVTVKTSNSDVRGGRGNKLLWIYWHSPDWTGTIQDTQFNLAMLSASIGSDIATGSDVYTEESITLGGSGAGVVTGTPISDISSTSPIYGWVTYSSGTYAGQTEKVTFSGQNFSTTLGVSGDEVCVRYYHVDSSAKSITVNANFIPKICKLVLETQLASSDQSSNIVGNVQIIVPRAQLTGSFTINMKSDGVSTTPIEYRALSSSLNGGGGCANTEAYAYINQVIDDALWTDDLRALAIGGGDFTLANAATKTLVVYAIHADGSVSQPDPADLTFASSVTADATVGLHTGLVTWISSGSSIISVYPTAAPAFDAAVTCTCSA